LQPAPSTRVTQLQVAFSAHSASQLHAPPPLARSSQYQPTGQMPLPQTLQVPSSQLGPDGLELVSGASLSSVPLGPLVSSSRSPSARVAEERGSGPEALPEPHAATSKTTAKQRVNAGIVPSVYVPWLWGYKSL
jgi:hypothetical protein